MADERYQVTGEYKGQTYTLASVNNKDEAEGVVRTEEPKQYYENLKVVDTQVETKSDDTAKDDETTKDSGKTGSRKGTL